MNYIEVDITITPLSDESREIVIALLGEYDFESFSDTEKGIQAFVLEEKFNPTDLDILTSLENFEIKWNISKVEQQNWNEVWESNFQPILVNNNCLVRAPFHEKNTNVEYEIVIEPKMSFGTGHHATTSLMIQQTLAHDFSNKDVLDMGTGTGILAILAKMRGAKYVEAIDIDEWAYENCIENVQRNDFPDIKVLHGDAALIVNKQFDIIFANINRNILLNDMKAYSACLKKDSIIFFSGIYTEDIAILEKEAHKHQISFLSHIEKDNWVSIKAIKK